LHPDPDLEALAALRQGDDSALDRLIARWEQPLFSFAWRYSRNSADAQDAVAETFVRLHQKRLQLRADTNLSAWLFTTLANLCHNQHRWKLRHPSTSLELLQGDHAKPEPGLEEPDLTPDAAAERDEVLERLALALDRLPHDLRTALLLHYFEHLSYREIAAIVGCSERGVETRLYRARRRLGAELGAWMQTTAAP
jgi:RNA polymerase sigma-70 factor (ECF subfamily)